MPVFNPVFSMPGVPRSKELIDFIVGGSHAVTAPRMRQPWSDGQAGPSPRSMMINEQREKQVVVSLFFCPGGIVWCLLRCRRGGESSCSQSPSSEGTHG